MFSLVLRRALVQRRLLAAVVALVATACTLVGTCTLVLDVTQDRAFREAVQRSDPDDLSVTAFLVDLTSSDATAARDEAAQVVGDVLAPMRPTSETTMTSRLRDLETDGARADSQAYLVATDALATRADLTAGRWPAPHDGRAEVVVPDTTARLLGLGPRRRGRARRGARPRRRRRHRAARGGRHVPAAGRPRVGARPARRCGLLPVLQRRARGGADLRPVRRRRAGVPRHRVLGQRAPGHRPPHPRPRRRLLVAGGRPAARRRAGAAGGAGRRPGPAHPAGVRPAPHARAPPRPAGEHRVHRAGGPAPRHGAVPRGCAPDGTAGRRRPRGRAGPARRRWGSGAASSSAPRPPRPRCSRSSPPRSPCPPRRSCTRA